MVRMRRTLPALVLALAASLPAQLDTAPGEVIEQGSLPGTGDRPILYRIRLLPPSSYPQLPAFVRQTLQQRGCMIPQTYQAHGPENVIRGDFERAGSPGWALLCSSQNVSTLLVFLDAASPPVELATHPDTAMCEAHDLTGVLGFAWLLDPAHPFEILAHPANRPYDHDGITDVFLGRYAAIHYYREGKWLKLEGSE
jgi:hypothetical protein